jgi:hypothetical protein
MSALDDAAAAALFAIQDAKVENIGALYRDGAGVARTPTRSSGGDTSVRGTLKIPAGSLLALFHNHPPLGRDDFERGRFSRDDLQQAQMLRVPSYISAGDRIRRYDPSSGKTEDVLAAFPWDEFKTYLMQKLLQRAPDDPRGLLR